MSKKLKICVYADSRGAGLPHAIRKYSTNDIDFSVCYLRGATLRLIWEMIEMDLLTSKVDIFIVYAGICDITDRLQT